MLTPGWHCCQQANGTPFCLGAVSRWGWIWSKHRLQVTPFNLCGWEDPLVKDLCCCWLLQAKTSPEHFKVMKSKLQENKEAAGSKMKSSHQGRAPTMLESKSQAALQDWADRVEVGGSCWSPIVGVDNHATTGMSQNNEDVTAVGPFVMVSDQPEGGNSISTATAAASNRDGDFPSGPTEENISRAARTTTP